MRKASINNWFAGTYDPGSYLIAREYPSELFDMPKESDGICLYGDIGEIEGVIFTGNMLETGELLSFDFSCKQAVCANGVMYILGTMHPEYAEWLEEHELDISGKYFCC
jgi:hypothetical protein